MAADTSKSLRNQVIYSVFVRNYSQEGTFRKVEEDLDRIRELGTDIIWLMPIHPVGEKHRKGSLGSPYAIRDYRAVNPEYGHMEDFIRLCHAIHEHGMKVIIDVVYNHTSPDSVLASAHPEWFFHKADGSFGNKTGDWWDVIDLDYSPETNRDWRGLWDYQIETLQMWARFVDGFRCDVAAMVPLPFWLEAREKIEQVRPGAIWLAESVEPEFVVCNRSRGIACSSDAELYQAFDLCYDYDIYGLMNGVLTGRVPLADYAAAVNRQEGMYPDNYGKARFLENHDRLRAAFLLPDERARRNWTAFCYFQKGTTLVYAGQERSAAHTPSLFDRDTVNWEGTDISVLMRRLSDIRHRPEFTDSTYRVTALAHDVCAAVHTPKRYSPVEGAEDGSGLHRMLGVFSLRGESSVLSMDRIGGKPVPDGMYTNLIDGSPVEINMGEMAVTGEAVILEIPG